MKEQNKISITIILLFTFLIFSCNKYESDTETILVQAEKLMDNHPDSAFILLNEIENPKELKGSFFYKYITLLVQAKDKTEVQNFRNSINIGI